MTPPRFTQRPGATLLLTATTMLAACQSTPTPAESNAPTPEQVSQARDLLSARQSAHVDALRSLQTEPLSDFVVLTQDTPLFHSEAAARAASPTPPPLASAYAQRSPELDDSHLATFLVLQDKEDVAEIGILPPDQVAYHCTPALSQTSLYNLEARFWVRKDAIVPVLREPWTVAYEDKSAYSFLPGTPVRLSSILHEDNLTRYNLSAHGFSVDVVQDEANPIELALSYSDPFSRASSMNLEGLSALPPDAILWLGQKPLLRVAELDRSLRFVHQQRRFDSQTIMVALATSCVQLAAIVNRADILRASSAPASSRPYRSPLTPSPLPRDAQGRILYWTPATSPSQPSTTWMLRWPDQTPAGITRTSRTIQGELDARASDESGMNCYTIDLNLDRPLCTPSKR